MNLLKHRETNILNSTKKQKVKAIFDRIKIV